jgi:signal transduction histidine kinase
LSVSQVVHDYEHVHQAAAELALEQDAPLTADDHHALDHAVAYAVTEYVCLRDQSIVNDDNERVGFLVHELRNQLTTATLAFAFLKGGRIGTDGSTAALLERSLKGLAELIDSSVAEVRLDSALQKRERILMGEFIEEIEIGGNLQASVRGVELTVEPVDTRIAVEANRPNSYVGGGQLAAKRLQSQSRPWHRSAPHACNRRSRVYRYRGRVWRARCRRGRGSVPPLLPAQR